MLVVSFLLIGVWIEVIVLIIGILIVLFIILIVLIGVGLFKMIFIEFCVFVNKFI